MATSKIPISNLPPSGGLDGSELIPVVEGSLTKQSQLKELSGFINLQYVTEAGNTTTQDISTNATIVTNVLSATEIHSLSSFTKVIDIKQFELSGFDVTGSITVSGDIDATQTVRSKGLTVDGGTLFVDPDNNKIGVNTNTPNEDLTVVGNISATNSLFISNSATINGYVGIGTTTPNKTLTVIGDISATGRLTVPTLETDIEASELVVTSGLSADGNTFTVDATNNRVGIGTNTPNNALTVVGDISANGSLSAVSAFIARKADGTGIGIGKIADPGASLDFVGTGYGESLNLSDTLDVAGQTTLADKLEVCVSSGEAVEICGGNVGIGTGNPNKTLTVIGDISATGGLSACGDIEIGNGFYNNPIVTVLNSSCRVGINKVNPDATLQVVNRTALDGGYGEALRVVGNALITTKSDAALVLQADSNNTGGDDEPLIKLKRGLTTSSSASEGQLGVTGNGNEFTGALTEATFIQSHQCGSSPRNGSCENIQLAVNDKAGLTVRGSDSNEVKIGIGTSDPNKTLTVVGDISANGDLLVGSLTAKNNLCFTGNEALFENSIDVGENANICGELLTKGDLFVQNVGGTRLLHADVSTSKVGINTGTALPNKELTVVGDISGSDSLFIANSASFGDSKIMLFGSTGNICNDGVIYSQGDICTQGDLRGSGAVIGSNILHAETTTNTVGIGTGALADIQLTVAGDVSANGSTFTSGSANIDGAINFGARASNDTLIVGQASSHDLILLRGEAATGTVGVDLKYLGSGSADENIFEIATDGGGSFKIDQTGDVGINTAPVDGIDLTTAKTSITTGLTSNDISLISTTGDRIIKVNNSSSGNGGDLNLLGGSSSVGNTNGGDVCIQAGGGNDNGVNGHVILEGGSGASEPSGDIELKSGSSELKVTYSDVQVSTKLVATSGVQLGTFTTAERDALGSPTGLIILNTTSGTFQGFTGVGWVNLS